MTITLQVERKMYTIKGTFLALKLPMNRVCIMEAGSFAQILLDIRKT
jgi:hypothetical protein